VQNLVEGFLYNTIVPTQPCPNRAEKDRFWEVFFDFLIGKDGQYGKHFATIFPLLADPEQRAVNTWDLLYSRESHQLTEKLYAYKEGTCAFFDFFWTWRSMLIVFMQVINVEIPPARVYHTASTGYAGLAGVVAKLRYGRPLILTEHGIYTNERNIEINRLEWMEKKQRSRVYIDQSQGTIRDLWKDNFARLSRVTYDLSDEIITLYEGNQKLQVEFGANIEEYPERFKIIPNGVRLDRYGTQRGMPKLEPEIRRVGLVGRVVPIKDIKMFIKVCKIVTDTMPNVLFQVIGPFEEDADYVQECRELAALLGVEKHCVFTGPKNLIEENVYPQLDIMALTSISEGQPLTILEALCVGVPCVTTNVGCCSELLYGRTEEDKALGICGYVVPIGNAEEFAKACLKILRDSDLQAQMIETGHQRIDTYYNQDSIVQQYRDLYVSYIADS
jgi:glycosyltransferase involved in cell wall biosynthesis